MHPFASFLTNAYEPAVIWKWKFQLKKRKGIIITRPQTREGTQAAKKDYNISFEMMDKDTKQANLPVRRKELRPQVMSCSKLLTK